MSEAEINNLGNPDKAFWIMSDQLFQLKADKEILIKENSKFRTALEEIAKFYIARDGQCGGHAVEIAKTALNQEEEL